MRRCALRFPFMPNSSQWWHLNFFSSRCTSLTCKRALPFELQVFWHSPHCYCLPPATGCRALNISSAVSRSPWRAKLCKSHPNTSSSTGLQTSCSFACESAWRHVHVIERHTSPSLKIRTVTDVLVHVHSSHVQRSPNAHTTSCHTFRFVAMWNCDITQKLGFFATSEQFCLSLIIYW